MIFPEYFGTDLNYYNRIREFLYLRCEIALNPTDKDLKALAEIQEYFIEQQFPSVFDPYEKSNILAQSETQFEEVCNTMEDQGSSNLKSLTEFEFYHKLRYYEKKFKAQSDANK